MKIRICILLIIQLLAVFSCKGDNIYNNKDVGFSFKIPKDCYLETEKKDSNKYFIQVFIDKPEDLLDGVQQFNNIKNKIENNEYPDIPNIPAMFLKYKNIGNVKVGLDFHRGYDIFDGVFALRMFFIKNNRFVTIYLQYGFEGPKDMNDSNNLKIKFQNIEKKYREKVKKGGITKNQGLYVINEIEKYIKTNKGKKTEIPEEISELFYRFDELVASLKFTK